MAPDSCTWRSRSPPRSRARSPTKPALRCGNAVVTITDTRTGATQQLTANAQGLFTAQNLTTGGPYTITATRRGLSGPDRRAGRHQPPGRDRAHLLAEPRHRRSGGGHDRRHRHPRAGDPAARSARAPPSAPKSWQNAPSFNRDVRDIIRIDPRVSLDREDAATGGSGADRISCLGGNDRGNTFTVDGIPQSDIYGLNDTGFSSRSSTPIPYRRGARDAGPVRAVRRRVWPVHRLRDQRRHQGRHQPVPRRRLLRIFGRRPARQQGRRPRTSARSSRTSAGASRSAARSSRTACSSSAPMRSRRPASPRTTARPAPAIRTRSPASRSSQFDEISDMIRERLRHRHRPAGHQPAVHQRALVRPPRLADHRRSPPRGDLPAARGIDASSPTTSPPAPSPQDAVGLNTFYLSGTDSNYYSGRLYSNWTDNFSTELRYSRSKIDDLQDPVGGGEAQDANPIPRIIVGVDNPDRRSDGTVQVGPGHLALGQRPADDGRPVSARSPTSTPATTA